MGGSIGAPTHNDNQCMLFHIKRTGVDVESESAQRQSPSWELLPCPADWKDEQLCDGVANGQGRVTQAEELVGTREDHDEDCEEEPGAESWKCDQYTR